MKDWLETALLAAKGAKTLRWAVTPELIKFQITMANLKSMHRVVNDRYTVRAKFMVE